jgi:hypothetical protein
VLFAFEYLKHGTGIARETTNYLFSRDHNLGMRHVSQFLALQVLPIAFHVVGILLVLLSALGFPRLKSALEPSAGFAPLESQIHAPGNSARHVDRASARKQR